MRPRCVNHVFRSVLLLAVCVTLAKADDGAVILAQSPQSTDAPSRHRIGSELLAQPATATEYYVAPDGKDSNPGTELLPWRTIQKAASTLVAGDTVYIKNGVYHETVVPANSGAAGNYITYSAYPGHSPIIDGLGVPGGYRGLFEVRANYILVYNSCRAHLHRMGAPTTMADSSAWAGLRTDRASLFLLAGPVLTRYRLRLDKFDSRSHWGLTSDIARCP